MIGQLDTRYSTTRTLIPQYRHSPLYLLNVGGAAEMLNYQWLAHNMGEHDAARKRWCLFFCALWLPCSL